MATFSLESLHNSWPRDRPAVVARRPRVDVFLVGENGKLYHQWQVGGHPFRMESLGAAPDIGGQFQPGALSAVYTGADRRDVFALTSSSRLMHYWQVGNQSFASERLGDLPTAGRPKAVSWGPGRWDAFLVGNDGAMHHWWNAGGIGHVWFDSGLDPYADIAAVSSKFGRIDVFAVARDHSIRHYWNDEGGIQFRSETLARLNGAPKRLDAVSWGPYRVDLFSSNNDLGVVWVYHHFQAPGQPFRWEEVATYHGDDLEVAATTWGASRLDVFVIDADEHRDARHHWQEGGVGFGRESLGGDWPGYLAACTSGSRRLDLFTIGQNKELFHHWQG
jgi:hypothetical protein